METDIPDENLPGFVRTIKQLGYNDKVLEYVYQRHPHQNPVNTVYEELKNDPEFLRRAQAGRGYNEPESPANTRPGDALEYLYYLLAIDNGAPTLCAKISPNTTFGTKGLLRAACYRSIAVKRRDANLACNCPHRTRFPQRAATTHAERARTPSIPGRNSIAPKLRTILPTNSQNRSFFATHYVRWAITATRTRCPTRRQINTGISCSSYPPVAIQQLAPSFCSASEP